MTTTISFNWWNTADKEAEIPEHHDFVLKVQALESIKNLVSDGIMSGDLDYSFSVNGGEVSYQGYWEFK